MARSTPSRKRKILDARSARLSIRIGRSIDLDASVTTAGLLAVGGLVTGILLSTAVIVMAARKTHRTDRMPAAPPPLARS